ncbi:HD domain-containing phosphohydrolase [uncultured Paludibaculum sp.]|uniref:HD domain-containing phosphohydrolase n=1 Tax=uncultured Paludibaculum sp. TaxID=1765020 RepID=UPI002AABACFF|nr:HD domain-containing phosphohydrolase [uncultured Paludibaculum sp.]
MTRQAQIYKSAILLLGLALAARMSITASGGNDRLFLAYLGLTVVTSLLRLGVPTAAGTISIGFVFILAGLAQLSLGQTVTIGITGTIIHHLRDTKARIDWLAAAFQAAVVVLGIAAAQFAFVHIRLLLPEGGLAAALPLAGTVLFLVTAFPLAAATALKERELLRRVWHNRFLWSLPYYLAGAALAGLLVAVARLPLWQAALIILPLLLLVYRAYGLQIDALARERLHAEELATLQLSMVEALALTVESKEMKAVDSLHRMAAYAVHLGRELGLKEPELRSLRTAAVLHDIGQVAVPDHIIMKPGRLTPEEYERLKVHPDVGGDIIERASFPYAVAPIVRAHHEHWDGSGYPLGLKGNQIPLEARVLAAVDTFVALRSERHYRRALPTEKAMAIVRREAGRVLDPDVVAALDRIYQVLDDEEKMAPNPSEHRVAIKDGQLQTIPEPAEATPAFLATIAAARQEEQSLLEFTQILGSSLNLHETLSAISRRFRRQIPFDTLVLYLCKEQRLEASFIDGENFTLFSGLSIAKGEGLSAGVAERRKPLLNGDPATEPFGGRSPEKAARLRSAMAVPLEGPHGVVGVLTFYAEKREAFTQSQLGLLLALTPKLAVTVENSLRFKQAENQASFDFLTGLPNAGSLFLHLQNELSRSARNDSELAVLVCDLDGFKQVNDRFGHLIGNDLLKAVAAGFKDTCREYDFVARLGGDEFVIVLPGATDEAVKTRRKRFSDMVEKAAFDLCTERVASLSVGVAFFPADGRSAEELLAKADGLMYQDKSERKALRTGMAPQAAHS